MIHYYSFKDFPEFSIRFSDWCLVFEMANTKHRVVIFLPTVWNLISFLLEFTQYTVRKLFKIEWTVIVKNRNDELNLWYKQNMR